MGSYNRGGKWGALGLIDSKTHTHKQVLLQKTPQIVLDARFSADGSKIAAGTRGEVFTCGISIDSAASHSVHSASLHAPYPTWTPALGGEGMAFSALRDDEDRRPINFCP